VVRRGSGGGQEGVRRGHVNQTAFFQSIAADVVAHFEFAHLHIEKAFETSERLLSSGLRV
jgi:hypothetical protein